MKFTPKTEEQLKAENSYPVFPEGEYGYEVIKAEDKTSAKGNEMIVLTLRVFGPHDKTTLVNDYLLEAMEFKLRHFCVSTGLGGAYEAGTLTAGSCHGRSGKVYLDIQPEKQGTDKEGNPKTFPPKNVVKDYVVSTLKPEDDVPF